MFGVLAWPADIAAPIAAQVISAPAATHASPFGAAPGDPSRPDGLHGRSAAAPGRVRLAGQHPRDEERARARDHLRRGRRRDRTGASSLRAPQRPQDTQCRFQPGASAGSRATPHSPRPPPSRRESHEGGQGSRDRSRDADQQDQGLRAGHLRRARPGGRPGVGPCLCGFRRTGQAMSFVRASVHSFPSRMYPVLRLMRRAPRPAIRASSHGPGAARILGTPRPRA